MNIIIQKFDVIEGRGTKLQVTRSTQRVTAGTMKFPKAQVWNTTRENLELYPAARATLSYDSIANWLKTFQLAFKPVSIEVVHLSEQHCVTDLENQNLNTIIVWLLLFSFRAPPFNCRGLWTSSPSSPFLLHFHSKFWVKRAECDMGRKTAIWCSFFSLPR